MPAKPVTIGSMRFDRKGDALKFFQAMLHKYYPGDSVSNDDAEVLKHLLARHPDSLEKIGDGVMSFSVRRADFNSKCFWVNRVDGTTVKFSYKSCV